MSVNILQYESDIWKTADYLRGAGIKESDFPKYMMPFFALLMVESRLIREAGRLENELSREDIDDFVEVFQLEGLGYNDYVIRQNKTLKTISQNDKNFNLDFQLYLRAFDGETKSLLGVERGTEEEKYLDISGVSSLLNKKRILFDYVKTWSEIDLTPFSNSEITTLEEHIKRKWADISAETAGEQYTPDDIISLISDIIVSKIEDNGKFLTIYDPTCGGGNLLFGVEDRIRETFSNRPTATFGEDWNDSLYALAKIESRFRIDSTIRHGNTLTDIKFIEKRFDVIVANPPYGVDWKGYQKDIQNDKTERFVALPSISDGQFLFTQHILYQLADDGISIVVHNGSTLFSGDAGSGESNIRKYFFDQDWVEAIIQMPTDEFFNTGIYTYLWVFNKNKPIERKDKVILIDASELYEPLKKSRGKKRKQMNFENRKNIVDSFTNFSNNNFAKVFDKWELYYNKQSIMLTNVDENGKSIEMPLKTNRSGETLEEKSIKLNPTKIQWLASDKMQIWTEFEIYEFNKQNYNSLEQYFEEEVKPLLSDIDYKEDGLKVHVDDVIYYFDNDKESIIEYKNGSLVELGCGKILIKPVFKKATKTKNAFLSISLELTKDLQKDYEVIPYSSDEAKNQRDIDAFMTKYITKPFDYLDNTVGLEINFNKVFYQPEKLLDVNKVLEDLKVLEDEITTLQEKLKVHRYIKENSITNGLNSENDLIKCDLDFYINKNWKRVRLKDIGYLYSGLSGKSGNDFNQDNNINNKKFIPFTNIANNTYINKNNLGDVLIFEHEKQNSVKRGDLFFLMSSEGYGDIGKTAVLMDDITETYLNSFCKGFRPNQKKCYPPFLNYLLLSETYRRLMILEGKGFTRINLKMEKVNNFEIYLPISVDEQKNIANFIYEKNIIIDSIIDNIIKKTEKLKELQKSITTESLIGNLKHL